MGSADCNGFLWRPISRCAPRRAPREARLRHSAIGVNYVDTYHRAGVPHPWPLPPLPAVIGFEGIGVVEVVGAEAHRAIGERRTTGATVLRPDV